MEDLARVAREKQRLASELEIAHQIQIGLLPNEHFVDASCRQFELHAALRPARAVGGDLYSYFMLDAPAPLRAWWAMSRTRASRLPCSWPRPSPSPRASRHGAPGPDQLLDLLNKELCRGNDSCMFVTLLCGLLDTATGRT